MASHGASIMFLYFQHHLKHTASRSNLQATLKPPSQTCLPAHLSHLRHLLNPTCHCSTTSTTYRSAALLGSKSTAHIGSATVNVITLNKAVSTDTRCR